MTYLLSTSLKQVTMVGGKVKSKVAALSSLEIVAKGTSIVTRNATRKLVYSEPTLILEVVDNSL